LRLDTALWPAGTNYATAITDNNTWMRGVRQKSTCKAPDINACTAREFEPGTSKLEAINKLAHGDKLYSTVGVDEWGLLHPHPLYRSPQNREVDVHVSEMSHFLSLHPETERRNGSICNPEPLGGGGKQPLKRSRW